MLLNNEPSIPFGCANKNVYGGELRKINFQSSSPKCKARHCGLEQLISTELLNLLQEKKNC
jgi:hypothetical protein